MISQFDADTFTGEQRFTYVGTGSLGAKAQGLAHIKQLIENNFTPSFQPGIQIDIPLMTVLATGHFDLFMKQNNLYAKISSPLDDGQIVHLFRNAQLPAQLINDLRSFITQINGPLAVRSSSLLEDTMSEPFAGVYATKMIPNNQPDVEERLQSVCEAIKYIYASTFFKQAKYYREATGHSIQEEKMAVIIQKVIGRCNNSRFYPHLSGIARSFNFYPVGLARPEDGIVEIALGLGKIIVEDGVAWAFSPAYPHANPPYNTPRDLLKQSQNYFWAIDMKESTSFPDKVSEKIRHKGTKAQRHKVKNEKLSFKTNMLVLKMNEEPMRNQEINNLTYLKKFALADAEQDGMLSLAASTYKAEDDRFVMGIIEPGPRIIDFARILKTDQIPLAELLKTLLRSCEESLGRMVEIEFAMTFPRADEHSAHFGFLQVRPMMVSRALVEVRAEELMQADVLVASESTLGNGADTSIRDIVYVKPQNFDVKHTPAIGREIEVLNQKLLTAKCPYILIGFGRWGSTDSSAGIPVNFGHISGARVIVEATLPNINFIPSQGSHFFHNITSFKILYFPVSHTGKLTIDWAWLDQQQAVYETDFIRHLQLSAPLHVKVDGRTRRGIILKE
ncbi:MAG: hypothetical protein A2Y62_04620 [Candidatus Fischerbacteria bacterium RBG_13_37_8]|uniref:Pyruvate phosphate dikinase AMP/ATP-binding domain-containing protein n=1 Tax=Candidatus Fischerbacteria bacterium RBG_13_37_8 TaxID=1817863 RepID=A0A1F5VNS5_9BACT|nr:MAG: hypothetical protein A2Y62_04620 [Candidatus Fischerbacteria bacterium RBG_13_37_8]